MKSVIVLRLWELVNRVDEEQGSCEMVTPFKVATAAKRSKHLDKWHHVHAKQYKWRVWRIECVS